MGATQSTSVAKEQQPVSCAVGCCVVGCNVSCSAGVTSWFLKNWPSRPNKSVGRSGSKEVVAIGEVQKRSSNAARTVARYHSGRPLSEKYEVDEEVLGQGYSGPVVLCKNKVDGKKYAMKAFSKSKKSEGHFELLVNESQVYLTLDHPNIARLIDVYETDDNVYLVMEYCAGGELFERLAAKNIFPEIDAIEATKQMLRAVGYLHSHGVVHRDVKLENFLYESEDDDSLLKLIDFGFAKFWDPTCEKMKAGCGSLAYVSPDVLRNEGYTSQCDVWSLGIVTFMLLSGYPPFHGEQASMVVKIKRGKVDWIERRWKNVSLLGRNFVEQLLTLDPDKRPNIKQAIDHEWLQSVSDCSSLRLESHVVRSLKRYSQSSRLHRAILQIMAQELRPEDTRALVDIFHKLDHSNEGVIRLKDLKDAIRGTATPKFEAATPKLSAEISKASLVPPTPASQLRRANSESIDDLFHLLDSNGDEQIYYSDFLAATMEIQNTLREDTIHSVFHRFDADRSGTIEAKDLKDVLGDVFEGVEVEQLIEEVTSPSAGGKITYEGFLRVLQSHNITSPKLCVAEPQECESDTTQEPMTDSDDFESLVLPTIVPRGKNKLLHGIVGA